MKTYYEVAEIKCAIEGNDDVANAIRAYFKGFLSTAIKEEDIQFKIIVNAEDRSVFIPSFFSLSSKYSFNNNYYSCVTSEFSYTVKDLFCDELPTVVWIWTERVNWMKKMKNFFSIHYIGVSSIYERMAHKVLDDFKSLMYIFAITAMKCNKVMIHASIFSHNDRAVIFTGTSGSGKTSALIKLLENKQIGYIADDVGIIGNKNVYRIFKKVRIDGVDVQYKNPSPLFVNASKRMDKWNLLKWNLLNRLGCSPICGFPADSIFSNVVDSSGISCIVYMTRILQKKIISIDIDIELMVEKMKDAMFRELRELCDVLYNIRSAGDENIRKKYPSMNELEQKYMVILRRAIEGEKLKLMYVPQKASPETIVKVISEEYL